MEENQHPLHWHNEKRVVKDLVPWEENPRILTQKQCADLKTSLEKFNLVSIPAIDTDNTIIAGHQRMKILAMLGRQDEEIDVRVPNRKLTEEEFKELNVRDNLNLGSWDWDKLGNWDTTDLLSWGFSENDLGIGGSGPVSVGGEDSVPDHVKVKVVAVHNDLFELKCGVSTIRLLCNTIQSVDAITSLMNGKVAEIAVMAFPKHLDNLTISPDAEMQLASDIVSGCAVAVADGAPVYFFTHPGSIGHWIKAFAEADFHWASTIIWSKNHPTHGGDYSQQYEPVYYGWKGAESSCKVEGEKKQCDVWSIDCPKDAGAAENQKPVEFIERAILNSSKPGAVCLDFFSGNGATGVACLKTGRDLLAMATEPRHCDIALRRWHEFLTESKMDYTITRNGETWSIPEVYEPEH